MTIGQTLLREFELEMKITRRVLERVPSDKPTWKPHPRSFSLAHLTQLIAGMPGWVVTMLGETSLDLEKFPGYSDQKTDVLLGQFDMLVDKARVSLKAAKDPDFDVAWTLKRGQQVLFTQPRGHVIREHLNHMVHHRGQMTVYLRLLDVHVPSIYGPTADEKIGPPQ